jgi:hypothetical protein
MDCASYIAAIAIAVLALLFTVGSFWWLNARRGSLTAVVPPVYAFVEGFRLRFPVAVFNDGAIPLLIIDLRVAISGAGTYEWQTTRTSLMPKEDDGHEFAVPFSVKGRDTATVIVEFGGDYDWLPKAGASHDICLEALIHGDAAWTELVTFTWWAPPSDRLMRNYIAHRNEPPSPSDIQDAQG